MGSSQPAAEALASDSALDIHLGPQLVRLRRVQRTRRQVEPRSRWQSRCRLDGETLIGCDNVSVEWWLFKATRAAFRGETLVFVNASGTVTGRLWRER